MARGNQRDKAREANLKKQAAVVSNPLEKRWKRAPPTLHGRPRADPLMHVPVVGTG